MASVRDVTQQKKLEMQLLMSDRLASLGTLGREHDVICFENAASAAELLSSGEAVDVILCDLMMPDVTGMEFHRLVSERDAAQAERIIFMTGGAFTAQARDFLNQVGNQRIEKPFSTSALRTMVSDMVS